MRAALIDEVVKWHNEDWRGNASRALWSILTIREKQEVLFRTENIWVHEGFLTGKIKGWDE